MSTRAPDFRYIYTNAFGMRLSNTDATIMFGVEEKPGDRDIYEQLGVSMTPMTLKVMLAGLQKSLNAYEAANGEIPIPAGKLEELDAKIKAGARVVGSEPSSENKP